MHDLTKHFETIEGASSIISMYDEETAKRLLRNIHGHITHSCDNKCFSRGLSYGGRTPADLLIDIVAGKAYDQEDSNHIFEEADTSEDCFESMYRYLIDGFHHPSFQGDTLLDFGSNKMNFWGGGSKEFLHVFADHCQRMFFFHDLEDVISAIDLPGGLLS
jgi:hypothetical protein